MLKLEQDVFLQLGSESRRLLHPTKVIQANDNAITVMLEGNRLSLDVDGDGLALKMYQDILIYYNLRREFLKQAARIVDVFRIEDEVHDQDSEWVSLVISGAPVPAESRQSYRVSTIHAELTASFGGSAACQLVDVSSKGFAVISPEKHTVGTVVTATPCFEDLQPTGEVCIQSVRALNDGRYRYGVHCVKQSFQAELQKLCMLLQRQQLRRLACRT
jgi:hypothetical protein